MSAAPLSSHPHQRSRPKTTDRKALALRAGEDALDGSVHGVTLLLFYKWLVARCFAESNCVISTRDAAEQNSVDPRTIRRYGPLLEAAGLIRRHQVRRGVYRYTITAYEPEEEPIATAPAPAPEVVAIEPDPFFSGPPCGSIDPELRIDRSVPSFNGSRDLQEEACRPGGEIGPVAKEFFGQEEPAHAETIALLRAERVSRATCRQLGSLQPAYVREQIDAARRCGRGREWPGFLVGVLRTGGVWGSSWTGEEQPKVEDPTKYESYARRSPDLCPGCGAWVPRGRPCPACYPEAPTPEPPPADDDDRANDKFRPYAGGETWTT